MTTKTGEGEELVPSQEIECLTYSVETVSRILSLSRGLTYEMIRQGKIPCLHFGRVIRVPRAALERLLAGEEGLEEDNSKSGHSPE